MSKLFPARKCFFLRVCVCVLEQILVLPRLFSWPCFSVSVETRISSPSQHVLNRLWFFYRSYFYTSIKTRKCFLFLLSCYLNTIGRVSNVYLRHNFSFIYEVILRHRTFLHHFDSYSLNSSICTFSHSLSKAKSQIIKIPNNHNLQIFTLTPNCPVPSSSPRTISDLGNSHISVKQKQMTNDVLKHRHARRARGIFCDLKPFPGGSSTWWTLNSYDKGTSFTYTGPGFNSMSL